MTFHGSDLLGYYEREFEKAWAGADLGLDRLACPVSDVLATGAKGTPVTFTVNVTNDVNATGWQWDFGDPGSKYNTLAGFVMLQLGKVPQTADRFEWGGLRFEVVDMDGKRVDLPPAETLAGVEVRRKARAGRLHEHAAKLLLPAASGERWDQDYVVATDAFQCLVLRDWPGEADARGDAEDGAGGSRIFQPPFAGPRVLF